MNTCETCKNYAPKDRECPRCKELKPANTFHQSMTVYYEYICRECLDDEAAAMCGEDVTDAKGV